MTHLEIQHKSSGFATNLIRVRRHIVLPVCVPFFAVPWRVRKYFNQSKKIWEFVELGQKAKRSTVFCLRRQTRNFDNNDCVYYFQQQFSTMMMMIDFITFNSSLVPLIEGLCSSNPWEFEFSGFRRNQTDDLGIRSPSLWPTAPRLRAKSNWLRIYVI